jgi:hypothetical protein
MKKYILLLAFIGYNSYAQTGIGTKTPDPSSALDIKLPNKGVLLSRIALRGTTDVTTIPSPANSLTVYNTANTSDVTPGYYYWSSTNKKWIRVLDSGNLGWSLTGNTDTIPGTNFIGTTDNKDLIFKRSNIQAGRLGDSNTSFGKSALMNSSGINNTAIGSKALELNIGTYNTAVGFGALQKNTNGAGNTAFGAEALKDLADGGYNIGIGMSSLARLTKGIHNVALGTSTLGQITTGNYNIAIGSGAGYTFMNGDNSEGFNTIIGSYDNHLIQGFSGGKNNTILGSRIKYLPNTSFSNNIIIADGEGNRRINVNDKGNVGLGTNTPHESAALDITSTNKGVLLPRVALTATNVTAPLSAVTAGMTVYNTATAGTAPNNVTPGQYYHNGSQWIRLMDAFSGWSLTGNTSTVPGTNFIGTTDNNDLIFKRYNVQAGRLGDTNTSFGKSSLNNPPLNEWAGVYNTAIGNKALEKNTSGNFNTAVGFGTLQNNITNNYNSAFGYLAMEKNTTGSRNTAIGTQALQTNIDGINNSAFGYLAMGKNTAGVGNTALGNEALRNFSEGFSNVGVGDNSLGRLTKGSNNVALGAGTLGQITTGNYNIAIGSGAGARFNTTDNSDGFNTMIGSNDNLNDQGFVSGKNNTIIGSRIKYLPSSFSNNIIIADGSGNRRINVDDKGNVGLGTNTPHESAALEVTSSINNKGLLLPRVALTATNVATPLNAVTAGMIVYNTVTAGTIPNNVTPGIYYHTGSEWIKASVDNLGNHTANQALNLADNNITNAKKIDTELLTIKKGADSSLPMEGRLAMAANAQGDIVWVDPDKLPSSIPAPSAIFKINTNQDILGGSAGSTSIMTAKLLANSIKDKISYNEATSKMKLKPGKYKIELMLSLLAPDSPSGTNIHSYFVDFPGQGGRIHQNQVAMGGTISNHGINISSIAIISNDTDWTIYLGRGQAGNYVGKTLIEGNDTRGNGNYIMVTQLPD